MPQTPIFRNIRAVIFDFDATIADTASDIIESKLYAMSQLGQPEPDRDLVKALLGMNTRDSFYVFSDMSNEVMVDEAVDLFHRQALRLALERPRRFFGGVSETLDELRRRRIKIGLTGNRRAGDLNLIIESWGLSDIVEAAVTFDSVKRGKPAPDMALEALNELGVDPEEAIIVGDALHDIEMGRNAGCATIAFSRGADSARELLSAGPDAIVDSIADIPALIA